MKDALRNLLHRIETAGDSVPYAQYASADPIVALREVHAAYDNLVDSKTVESALILTERANVFAAIDPSAATYLGHFSIGTDGQGAFRRMTLGLKLAAEATEHALRDADPAYSFLNRDAEVGRAHVDSTLKAFSRSLDTVDSVMLTVVRAEVEAQKQVLRTLRGDGPSL